MCVCVCVCVCVHGVCVCVCVSVCLFDFALTDIQAAIVEWALLKTISFLEGRLSGCWLWYCNRPD